MVFCCGLIFASTKAQVDMPQSLRPSLKPIGVLQTVTSMLVPMADRPSSTDDDFRSSYNDTLAIAAVSGAELQSCTDFTYADEQRESFNKLLTTCMKEFPHTRTRPIPVIISDGKVVDLYELSNSVKKQGGFDLVSANKMWASIAGDLGFGAECAPSLKLVYVKYLKLLDKWVQRAEYPKCNGLSLDHQGKKRNGEKLSFQHVDSFHGTGLQKSPIVISDNSEQTFYLPDADKQISSGVRETSNGNRRNVSLSGMLEWINWVARNPCGSMKGEGAKISKRSEEWFQECLNRANRAREVLYLRRQEYQYGDMVHAQKKQKVHPSLYEESSAADHQALDRLRVTDKRVALYGFQQSPSASPSVTSSVPGTHTLGSYVSSVPNCLDTRVQDVSRAPANVFHETARPNFLCLERMPRKRIPIGPYFQAVVPSWDGLPKQSGNVACSSVDDLEDSRFLGTQIWPIRGGRKVVNKERIGKGRSTCFCEFRGSIECVRFHIHEERERLKSELGSSFFTWRFDDMGEDVSRSWAPAEERKFRALVRLNPVSLGKNFWNHLPSCFPSKSMEMLVSYYFNVFVLRRRSIQNRATPEQIDSDDDESEFGFIENFNMHGMVPSGMRNVERLSRGSYLGQSSGNLLCHQNMQDHDFDVLGERESTVSEPFIGSHSGVQNRHGTSCLNYSMAESGINENGT